MSALHQALRLRRRRLFIFVLIFILALPLIANAQPQSNSNAAVTPDRLAAVIEGAQARPVNPARINEARAVAFDLLGSARYGDALTVFDAINDAVRSDIPSLYGSALAFFNLRRLNRAEELTRRVIEMRGAGANSSSSSETLDVAASANVQPRNWRAEALTLLGVILAVKGDNAGALSALREAVALAPENYDAQLALGRALYGASDPKGAATAFRAAIRLKPDDAKTRFFLATTLEAAGDDAGAETAYRELLTLRPDSAEGHLGLGVLLVKLGADRENEGIKELSRAISLNGELYEARIALGRALVRHGRPQEALEHLQRAAALAPRNPEPHYQLALAYRRLGRTAEAEKENANVKEIHAARRANSKEGAPGMSSNDQERRP
jgi:Flp pilus assembly protein TadD